MQANARLRCVVLDEGVMCCTCLFLSFHFVFNSAVARVTHIDGPDFSSGSDEVYIPESYSSDTDISVGDNFITDTNHSLSRASVTLQNPERNVVEEVPVTSHKRKQKIN